MKTGRLMKNITVFINKNNRSMFVLFSRYVLNAKVSKDGIIHQKYTNKNDRITTSLLVPLFSLKSVIKIKKSSIINIKILAIDITVFAL